MVTHNYIAIFRTFCYIALSLLFVALYIPGAIVTSPWFASSLLAPLFVWVPWTLFYLAIWFIGLLLTFGFLAYRQYRQGHPPQQVVFRPHQPSDQLEEEYLDQEEEPEPDTSDHPLAMVVSIVEEPS